MISNPDQLDTDEDGLGDVCDENDDGDGINDDVDNCPIIVNPGQEDDDNDGLGNVCETDSDDDGIDDDIDNCPLVSNADQLDTDDDGLGDVCDEDDDGDGINDDVDNCPIIVNPTQEDDDNDGLGNVCEDDSDDDGIDDDVDNCPLISNADQLDTDEDGLGDVCEEDDGQLSASSLISNSDQLDTDEDGLGDVCDEDDDGDGVNDDVDNCRLVINPDQKDIDNDGIGDVCQLISNDDCFDIDCNDKYGITFESYLVKEGYDDVIDGVIIPTSAMQSVKYLDISRMNMVDLTGIEYFTGLEVLIADENEFQRGVDFSKNTNLKHLSLDDNNLTSLSVDHNILLEELILGGNKLSEIDLSNNLLLNHLELKYNNISRLDVSANLLLESLSIKENGLSLNELLLGNNSNLKYLNASYNELDDIDLSGVLNLVELHLNDNDLSGVLNLDAHNRLEVVELCNNNLEGLVQCSIRRTLPQKFDTLEEFMVYAGLDTDGLVNNVISPSVDVSTMKSLDLSNRCIVDMSGIEYFVSLEELHMSGNNAVSIDFSNNGLLRLLDVKGNSLESLDISNQVLLEELYAGSNLLTNVDLTNNLLLKSISLKGNNLNRLDVEANESLVYLEVQDNGLTELILGHKMALTHLYAKTNKLTNIDVTEALNLIVLSVENNLLEGTIDLNRNVCLLIVRLGGNILGEVEFKNQYNSRVQDDNFSITNNPNLTCVKVDNRTYSTLNWTTHVDDSSVFTESEDCSNVSDNPLTRVVLEVVDRAVVVPADVVELKLYRATGELVTNSSLSGIYYVRLLDVNGDVKISKILVE